MHIFFAEHAKEIEIPREGRVRVPDLAGQMAEEVSGIVSVQGYLAQFEEDGELHRTLLLHSFPRFRIKARTPWGVTAPEEIVDPTVSNLLDALGYATTNGQVIAKDQPSSRGKQIEEEVPQDDSIDPQDVPEPEEVEHVMEYQEKSLPALRAEARKQGVDLTGARNRTQIIERLVAAEKEGQGADGNGE
jgi:hypothetical protein